MILIAGVAAGNEQPQVVPTRDVDIAYQITHADQPSTTERWRWSASDQLQRVDGPDKAATIFDRKRREFTVIDPRRKTYRVFEGEPRMPPTPGNSVVLQRGGEATVAKLHCVDWSWTPDTEIHTACLTPDGVMLRLDIDGKTVTQARSVTFSKQRAETFQVPRGYEPAIAPEGGPD